MHEHWTVADDSGGGQTVNVQCADGQWHEITYANVDVVDANGDLIKNLPERAFGNEDRPRTAYEHYMLLCAVVRYEWRTQLFVEARDREDPLFKAKREAAELEERLRTVKEFIRVETRKAKKQEAAA